MQRDMSWKHKSKESNWWLCFHHIKSLQGKENLQREQETLHNGKKVDQPKRCSNHTCLHQTTEMQNT